MIEQQTCIFPRFSAGEYRRRYASVWAEMEKRHVDGLVIYGDSGSHNGNQANIFYLTGYRDPLFSYALVPLGEEPILIMSNQLYLPHAKTMAVVGNVDWATWNPPERVAAELKRLKLDRARLGLVGLRGIQKSTLPHEHVEGLRSALPGASWEDATEILQQIRKVKSGEEIERLRKGAEMTDATVAALRQEAREGMTELQLAGIIAKACSSLDGEQRVTFIGATPMDDPQIIFPRQEPSHRKLQKGDVVLTELSASYAGYAGQIHRALVVGSKPTPAYREIFEVAREAYERVLSAIGPGKTDEDVRRGAIPIKEKGFWTFDALVHGWGLTIEPPRLDLLEIALIKRPQEPIVFKPGMCMVVQPHVLTADKRRGLQIGSLVLVTETGAEALQKYPMEFVEI
ncbi:MAG: aminopeptidase P family protein [Burkholderiales bacterium]|nr:aminopeptidase P family protein [Burkholderiales bacterium]